MYFTKAIPDQSNLELNAIYEWFHEPVLYQFVTTPLRKQ